MKRILPVIACVTASFVFAAPVASADPDPDFVWVADDPGCRDVPTPTSTNDGTVVSVVDWVCPSRGVR